MSTPNCVDDYAKLRTVVPPASPNSHHPACDYIFVSGRSSTSGFQGFFVWRPDSLDHDDGGIVIRPASISPAEKGRWQRVFDGPISVRWFGAKGDSTTDDTKAIQAALEAAGTMGKATYLSPGTYRTTAPLLIKHNYMTVCADGAIIDFYGAAKESAIDCVPIPGGVKPYYPFGLRLLNVAVYVQNVDTIGIRWRFSRSYAESVTVFLPFSNRIAWQLPGDAEGTGPYYNAFVNCFIDGHLEANQVGWDLAVDGGTGHAPNANVWLGGRTAACSTAYSIAGSRNAFYAVTVEATTKICFNVDHPSVPGGALGTVIDHPYVEGDENSNPSVFQIGPNAKYTRIAAPVVTSIGSGTVYSNLGVGTQIDLGDEIDLATIDFRLLQGNATQKPRVHGLHPGWYLTDPSASEIWIVNDSATSALGQAYNVWDQTQGKYILRAGISEFRVMASQLEIGNGTASWLVGNGSPEGVITAPLGSIYTRTDGGAGTTLYIKEMGVGDTGWVAK